MVLLTILYKVVLNFKSVEKTLECNQSIQIKCSEQYLYVVLYIMLDMQGGSNFADSGPTGFSGSCSSFLP